MTRAASTGAVYTFEVGDRVQPKKDEYFHKIGPGTIVRVYPTYVVVRHDSHSKETNWTPRGLELLEDYIVTKVLNKYK
jgi:hypothetical protein